MDFKEAFEIFQRRKRCDLCLRAEDEQCIRCKNRKNVSYRDLQQAYQMIEEAVLHMVVSELSFCSFLDAWETYVDLRRYKGDLG